MSTIRKMWMQFLKEYSNNLNNITVNYKAILWE